MSELLVIQDNQHTIPVCMPNSNGAGADTPEQNSHDGGSELLQATSSGNVSMTQALLSPMGPHSYITYTDGLGRTSLFKAASNGNIPIVAHLMSARCSIILATTTGATPLSVAVRRGHHYVSHLITVRCNVDLAMANGSTPLLVAVREGHATIVSQLITARCNVDITKTDGTTPFFIASKHGHVAVVVQLIVTRYNVNLTRTDGVTPFLMATAKGHRAVVQKLITSHCDVNLRCGYGSQNVSLVFSMVSRPPCPPNLCPCLCTVHSIKYHSVSFSDVFIGEFRTLCPTLRHVHSKDRATDPDFIYDNDGTKPSPSSVLHYFIENNSCHYQQL
jgi:ankyrin repeat protein